MAERTNKGNLKNTSITNAVLIDKRTVKIARYWQKRGIPFYPTDKETRQKQFETFMKVDDKKSLDFPNRAFKTTAIGLNLAWSYHPHAWSVSCKGKVSPYDILTYNKNGTLYLGIRKTLKGEFFAKLSYEDFLTDKGIQSIRTILRRVTGGQMVSNFRPVTASSLYKLFCDPGDTIWDMSCGWGGRLLGSIKAKVNYIGTDPAKVTMKGLKQMVTTFGNKANRYELLVMGSEEYKPKKNSLDFAFTSPPYYDTEKYSKEKTQSYIKFKTLNEWKVGFLKKTFENVYHGLKPNKFMAINVADVKSHYDSFEQDTVDIAMSVGFKLVDTFYLVLPSQQQDSKDEPIFIFKK